MAERRGTTQSDAMMRVCKVSGCGTVYPSREGARCKAHRTEANRARGSRQARGYDADHDRLRRQWAPIVARGGVRCARCGKRIAAGAQWDLGHDDHDRTKYTGPECVRCNRSAGGKAAHH